MITNVQVADAGGVMLAAVVLRQVAVTVLVALMVMESSFKPAGIEIASRGQMANSLSVVAAPVKV